MLSLEAAATARERARRRDLVALRREIIERREGRSRSVKVHCRTPVAADNERARRGAGPRPRLAHRGRRRLELIVLRSRQGAGSRSRGRRVGARRRALARRARRVREAGEPRAARTDPPTRSRLARPRAPRPARGRERIGGLSAAARRFAAADARRATASPRRLSTRGAMRRACHGGAWSGATPRPPTSASRRRARAEHAGDLPRAVSRASAPAANAAGGGGSVRTRAAAAARGEVGQAFAKPGMASASRTEGSRRLNRSARRRARGVSPPWRGRFRFADGRVRDAARIASFRRVDYVQVPRQRPHFFRPPRSLSESVTSDPPARL